MNLYCCLGNELASVQANIRAMLSNAVEKRVMSKRRIGSFLSGKCLAA